MGTDKKSNSEKARGEGRDIKVIRITRGADGMGPRKGQERTRYMYARVRISYTAINSKKREIP